VLTPVCGSVQAIEKEAKKEVDAAVDAAKTSPEPEEGLLYQHIHSDTPHNFEVRRAQILSRGVPPCLLPHHTGTAA
jgi:TPP-dependent pyruvate/acetoin dehydrogenase alpha subunit